MIDDALRQSKPSVLAGALGTARPVIKPSLPTGPKPAPAPAVAPEPVVPKTGDALIAAGRVSKDEDEIGRAMFAADEEKRKANQEIATEEQRQKVANTEREAKIAEDYATKFRSTTDKQKDMLNSSYGSFVPTKETAGDIASIFSLMTLATMGAGTQSKYSGMNALANLTGAMKGYKEGREDLYKKEMALYDKNVAEFARRTDNNLKEMKLALDELSVDKDAAIARARAVAAADTGSLASLKIRSGDYEGAYKDLQRQHDAVQKINQRKDELIQKYIEFLIREEGTREGRAATQAFREASLALRQEGLAGAANRRDEKKTAADLKVELPIIQGIRSIENLQAQLRDPDVKVGLQAKVAPLLQKVFSFKNNNIPFEQAVNAELTSTDKTTVFLKDALLASYEIERAAKNNQRLTVQDIKTIGPVLDPTNYKPETYNQILEDRRRVLYNNAQDLGMTPKEIKERTAQRPYEPYSGSTPKDSDKTIPTVSSKEQYDALPPNAIYMEDGKQYRKPK
jgi:hypothetical protein